MPTLSLLEIGRVCRKCVLPEHSPEIWLNEEGICNICVDYASQKPAGQKRLIETDFLKILEKFRGKSKYDCLLMCSGGKDSIASLYYIKTRYKLNPLVFTFDNSFEHNEAIQNVSRAVEILGADWIYFRSGYMKEMYEETLRVKAKFSICMLCSLWYMQRVYNTADQYDLKLIIGGWTGGQLNVREREMKTMTKDIPAFVELMRKRYAKYSNFPKNMDEVRKRFKISKEAIILSPHWFLPFSSDEYIGIISKELDWKPIKSSYPLNSSNCSINSANSYELVRQLGFTHFHVEMSRLIRCAKLSREEALRALEIISTQ